VIVPTRGAVGVTGATFITTLADKTDTQPASFVTVKECVPAARPEITVEVPVPGIAPGLIVQLPVGKPLSTTLPVGRAQVGCVIVPISGADGAVAEAIITTFADVGDTQPDALVTVKLYVPGISADKVVDVPEPVMAPGLIVQLPAGKPLNITLPVESAQVGCVIVPATGAVGVAG
jgi:hypothetical protein